MPPDSHYPPIDSIPATGHLTWSQIDRTAPPENKLVGAEGVYLHYEDGSRAIDASGGPLCVGIGHGRAEIAEAVARQMAKVSYGFDTEAVQTFRETLAAFTPGDLNRFYTCGGGSEAVEAAIRFARHYHVETGSPTKYKVISRWNSYHGNTLGAASVSGAIGRRKKWSPQLVEWPRIEACYCYRCPFALAYPDCEMLCAHKLEELILREGPDSIAAFITEPIIGSAAGVVIPPPEYFKIIREICDKYNVLLIADEIMTGFGRTGKNFGMQHFGVIPDVMTMGKGVTSGYIPMGAMAVRETLVEPFEPRVEGFGNIHTFSHHPVACAASTEVINIIQREGLVERSEKMGRYLSDQLAPVRDHAIVGDIRGIGLFAGIELVRDKVTREPFPAAANARERLLVECRKRGAAFYSGGGMVNGSRGDHLMIGPPFVVTEEQIDEIVGIIAESLDAVAGQVC